jgi:ATP-dependent DNA helicase DinG
MTTKVVDFDSAQEALARSLPAYERRAPQATLAHAIEAHLAGSAANVHLLGEAGTGTGKSLGYLIPAITSGKRVIISTATKALQDQIAFKDLPFLKAHLGIDFTYAILKGKSNYFCEVAGEKAALDNPDLMKGVYAKLNAEKANFNFLAEKDDFDNIDPRDWSTLTTSTDDCPGRKKCPFGETCYAERAKDYAKAAQVVVVNHALLLTDLRIREATQHSVKILGDYDAVIFDEAHEIEEYATSCWQIDLKERKLTNLSADVKNFAERVGTKDNETAARLSRATAPFTAATQALWRKLPVGRLLNSDIADMKDEIMNVFTTITDVASLLADIDLSQATDRKAREGNHLKLTKRIENISDAVAGLVFGADTNDSVAWVDVETFRNVAVKTLHSAPINVAPLLSSNLFAQNRPCPACDGARCRTCHQTGLLPNIISILVSATLSVNRKFDFISNRLGVGSYDGLDVGTPFDYTTQARLYVPKHLPEPTQANMSRWSSLAINEINELVTASDGRALLLFTSTKQMKLAYDALAGVLPYTCLVQGVGSNKDLAAKFMDDTHSVLFATRSFFTGVDFQGSACSLVVIDRLVFDVPTDPIFAARCEAVERAGGKSFFDYSVPKMSLTLKQGFGRLIRHRDDWGVVAILDSRVITKGYGKTVLNSLPDAPVLTELSEVKDFFESGRVVEYWTPLRGSDR